MTVKQTIDAKEKLGRKIALKLAASVATVAVAKQGKVITFSMKKDPPDHRTLLIHMLGPTGNLRAPTIRKGKTLLVGFDEETYRKYL